MIESRKPQRRRRDGYTLLELLIASVLIAALMTAVWNLMAMYSGFLTAGRSQATEQQLARSLLDLLATDMGAIVPQPPQPRTLTFASSPSESSSGPPSVPPDGSPPQPPGFATESSSARGLQALRQPTEPSREFEAGPPPTIATQFSDVGQRLPEFAIRGDRQSLTLIVCRAIPDRQFHRPADERVPQLAGKAVDLLGEFSKLPSDATIRAEGWQQIVYHFVPPRAVRADDAELPPGLHRLAMPVELLGRLADMQPVNDTQFPTAGAVLGDTGSAKVVEAMAALHELGVATIEHEWIPEVVSCRFTYLTDAGWEDVLQQDATDERPVAVRIQLGLLSPREQEQLMTALGSTDAGDATPLQEDVRDTSTTSVNQADPFAAFQPRPYERMIVLRLTSEAHGFQPVGLQSPQGNRETEQSTSSAGKQP